MRSFGDGAGAMVYLEMSRDSKIIAVIFTQMDDLQKSYGYALQVVVQEEKRDYQEIIEKGEHFPYMNGKVVFVHAIKKMSQTVVNVLEKQNAKRRYWLLPFSSGKSSN